MKLRKEEIEKLSEFMNWDITSTKKAIKHYRQLNLAVNNDDFLRVCINSSSDADRSVRLFKFVWRNISGNYIEKLATIIEQDDLIHTYLFFNTVDSLKRQGYTVNLDYIKTQYEDSTQFELFDDLIDQDGNVIFNFDEYGEFGAANFFRINKERILQEIFYYIVRGYERTVYGTDGFNFPYATEEIILELASYSGFKIFEIPRVRFYVNESDGFFKYPDFLARIARSINDPFLNRANFTKRRYWLIYSLVEKLKERFGTLESFRLAAKILNTSKGTVHARYYGMKREIRKSDLNLNQVIKENGLGKTINNLLKKIET